MRAHVFWVAWLGTVAFSTRIEREEVCNADLHLKDCSRVEKTAVREEVCEEESLLQLPKSGYIPEEAKEHGNDEHGNNGHQVLRGARVMIHGLKKRPEFNGKEGIAESWSEPDRYWRVKFHDGEHFVRPENLREADAETPSNHHSHVEVGRGTSDEEVSVWTSTVVDMLVGCASFLVEVVDAWSTAASQDCSTNYGENSACCGKSYARDLDGAAMHICSQAQPTCIGYKPNETWGKCQAETADTSKNRHDMDATLSNKSKDLGVENKDSGSTARVDEKANDTTANATSIDSDDLSQAIGVGATALHIISENYTDDLVEAGLARAMAKHVAKKMTAKVNERTTEDTESHVDVEASPKAHDIAAEDSQQHRNRAPCVTGHNNGGHGLPDYSHGNDGDDSTAMLQVPSRTVYPSTCTPPFSDERQMEDGCQLIE